jgi:hypothetical protein
MYQITDYSYKQAQKLNVGIKPSSKKGKKIDVIKNGQVVASVGALGYSDYSTYIKEKGLKYANKRRELYKQRHKNDINKIGSNGYFADKLLW